MSETPPSETTGPTQLLSTDDLAREDRAILEVLDRLGRDPLDDTAPEPTTRVSSYREAPFVDGPGDETLRREMREIISLLPYALEPSAPDASTKSRVLAAVGAPVATSATPPAAVSLVEDRDFSDLTLMGAAVLDEDVSTDPTLVRSAGLLNVADTPAAPEPAAASDANVVRLADHRRGSAWTLPLAAMLGVAVVGLAFLTGQWTQQKGTIARLTSQLETTAEEVTVQDSRQSELLEMERRFQMITTVAQQAYPMRAIPRSGESLDVATPTPAGIVYVCGNHQQWYLNLQGLEPPPEGHEYHLWYVTDDGAIDGGVLTVRPERPAEMESPTMPNGTRGFAVTLEERGSSGTEPAGPFVLLGDHSISL